MAKSIEKQARKKPKNMQVFMHYTYTALVNTIELQADMIKRQRKNNIGLFVVVFMLVIALAVVVSRPLPEPKYFGWDGEKFTQLTPLTQPPANLNAVRTWVEKCMIDALDLSFINPVKKINSILNDCFNDNGKNYYQSWLTKGYSKEMVSLGKAGSIPIDSELGRIMSQEIALDASPKHPSRIYPIDPISDPDTQAKILRWEISFPILLRREASTTGSTTSSILATIIVVRDNNPQFKQGVSIDSFRLTRGK